MTLCSAQTATPVNSPPRSFVSAGFRRPALRSTVPGRRITIGRPSAIGSGVKLEGYRSAPGRFAKEPLRFLRFNTQSISIQNYFQIGHVFIALAPKLSRIRIRHPVRVFFRVSPRIFLVFMFRPSVFAENHQKLSFSRR